MTKYFDLACQLAYAQAADALGLSTINRPQLYRPCDSCASYATLEETRDDGVQVFRCEHGHTAMVATVRV